MASEYTFKGLIKRGEVIRKVGPRGNIYYVSKPDSFGYSAFRFYGPNGEFSLGNFEDDPHVSLVLLDGCQGGEYEMERLDKYKSHVEKCDICQRNYKFYFGDEGLKRYLRGRGVNRALILGR
jgi:hypothetical protein